MKITPLRRASAILASTAVAVLSFGVGSLASSTSASAATPKGTVTWAELPGASPNYIFPLASFQYFSVDNLSQFDPLLYRPLYWFGVGGAAKINYKLSVGKTPVWSNNGTSVTINLNKYMWSNGEQVSGRDVAFWINLLKAEKAIWADYTPGDFPDNVTSMTNITTTSITLNLDKAYNQSWFLYNELSQITPLPIAWDVTSASATPPTAADYNSPSLPDTIIPSAACTTGATAPYPQNACGVYDYLDNASQQLSTYATSPIWTIIDGPYKLQSFSTAGQAVFVPNPSYTGPVKSKIAKFIEEPFTSEDTEFNQIKAGTLDMGYIPSQDVGQRGQLKSKGYTFAGSSGFQFTYFVENFNNPTLGPVFKQLYFRQALQHLVDQPAWISAYWKGFAVPTYGPVPVAPPNPFVDSYAKVNHYPYSISAAKSLLKSNGWTVTPGGTTTCTNPGTGKGQCGAGITQGQALTINLQYASGTLVLTQEMQALKSAASQVGISINLTQATFNTVISTATPCAATAASCGWEFQNWGAGWIYSPDFYPSGESIFSTGAGSNNGSYSDPKADTLITATNVASSQTPQQALNAYQNYMAQQLPVVYFPTGQTLNEYKSNIKGVTFNAYQYLTPEYFSVG